MPYPYPGMYPGQSMPNLNIPAQVPPMHHTNVPNIQQAHMPHMQQNNRSMSLQNISEEPSMGGRDVSPRGPITSASADHRKSQASRTIIRSQSSMELTNTRTGHDHDYCNSSNKIVPKPSVSHSNDDNNCYENVLDENDPEGETDFLLKVCLTTKV